MEARSFLEYTKEWVKAKNRGGLVEVNDNMFILIRQVENLVRNVLTLNFLKTYRGEDLREVINDKILESPLIQSGWSQVARNLGGNIYRSWGPN